MYNTEKKESLERFLDGVNNISTYETIAPVLCEQGWIVHPVYFRTKIVGGIVEKDGEIHTSIHPDYQCRWNPRPYIKSILYPALDKYGVLYSDAEKRDFKSIKWLKRLGFEYIREDEDRFFYVLRGDAERRWQ